MAIPRSAPTDSASTAGRARLDLLAERVRTSDLDALIVVSDWKHKGNLRYLADRVLWSRWAYVVVRPDAPAVLVTIAPSQQYWARREGWIDDVRFAQRPIEEITRILRTLNSTNPRIGIAGLKGTMRWEDHQYLATELANCELTEASSLLEDLRRHKTPAELESARTSMAIAEEAYNWFCCELSAGRHHWELVGGVEKLIRGSGCYDTMILLSTGPFLREPADMSFHSGDVVMFSIELAGPDGYWVERGGTISIGAPLPETRELFEVCKDAFQKGAALLTPGTSAATVAETVEEVLECSSFEKGIWGGHGIGLDVLEPPILLPTSDVSLTEHSIIALHPHVVDSARAHGAYISDTFAVGFDKPTEPLAKLPHELTVVPA